MGVTETPVSSEHPLSTPAPAKFSARLPGRIPSLDGLRAISILLVVVGHAIPPKTFPQLFTLFGHLGNYGVRIFFLISGFLITTLLLKEFDRTGRISLKNFYIRRSLRIFPAFYLYVITIVILSSLGLVVLYRGDLLHTLTYTMNYHLKRSWYLNHIWSLSVEEQFYLLWPAVILLVRPRAALKIALWVIVLAPVIRLFMVFVFDASPTALTRHFQAVSDALATGCLLAGFYNWLGRQDWYMRFSGKFWVPFLAGLILAGSGAGFLWNPLLFYIPGQSLANLGGILLIDHAIRHPGGWFGQVMNWKPLAYIGMWSYSIYLWQELFLDHEKTGLGIPLPYNVILTFAVSILSYYLIEQQFLKLKDRFTS